MNEGPTRHGFGNWIGQLDRILRGQATSLPEIKDGTIRIPVVGLSVVLVVLAAIYGFSVGWYALFNRPDGPGVEQLIASTVKMPALFFLTLVITFPSLYVFNVLVGSRLSMISMVRLLLAAMAVTLAVLASFATIVAFFAVTTTNYSFMSLLNVLCCTVGGVLGLLFLFQTLHRLTIATEQAELPSDQAPNPDLEKPQEGEEENSDSDAKEGSQSGDVSVLDRPPGHVLSRHTRIVFSCWMILFALVGGQMSWVLRPFIGDPNRPFEIFRARESNFFEAVWRTLLTLFGFPVG